MLAIKEHTGELFVNTEELDIWLSRFFSRLEIYALNTGGANEAQILAIGELAGVVVECVGENISSAITTDIDATGRTSNVCHLSIDESNMCLSLALAAFERGHNLSILSNMNCQ